MDQVKIGQTIRQLRRQRGIGQEVLSQALGVSVQAISKWETEASLPDVLLLPDIARFFGVSIDLLFRGSEEPDVSIPDVIPDDGRVRILQFVGRRYLSQEEYDPEKPVYLDVKELPKDQKWDVEIWGSAHIEGDIGGGVNAGGGVNCGSVGDGVNAGGGVNCGPVGDGVNAGGGVNCGPVGDGVNAGGGVNCGDVGDGVKAGGDVNCGDVKRDIVAGCDIQCKKISGNASAGGNIECGNIEGDVSVQGDVHCNAIKSAGRIECKSLICKKGHIHCDQIVCPQVKENP